MYDLVIFFQNSQRNVYQNVSLNEVIEILRNVDYPIHQLKLQEHEKSS